MLKKDEQALVCDLAETYQIYDYRSYPVGLIATLAAGLRDDSRIKMQLNDIPLPAETLLLVAIYDRLNLLMWSKTKDAEKGRNRPQSVLKGLIKQESNVTAYANGEDFIKARNKLIGR